MRALLNSLWIASTHAYTPSVGPAPGYPYPAYGVPPPRPRPAPPGPMPAPSPLNKDTFVRQASSPRLAAPAPRPIDHSQHAPQWVSQLPPDLQAVHTALVSGRFFELPLDQQNKFSKLYEAEIAEMKKNNNTPLMRDKSKSMLWLSSLGSAFHVIPLAVEGGKLLNGVPIQAIRQARAVQALNKLLGSKHAVMIAKIAGFKGQVLWTIVMAPKVAQLDEQSRNNRSNGQVFATAITAANTVPVAMGKKALPFVTKTNIIVGGMYGDGAANLNSKVAGRPYDEADFSDLNRGKEQFLNGDSLLERMQGAQVFIWGEAKAAGRALGELGQHNIKLFKDVREVGLGPLLFEKPLPDNTPDAAVEIPDGLSVQDHKAAVARRKDGTFYAFDRSEIATDGFLASGIGSLAAEKFERQILGKRKLVKWGVTGALALPATVAFLLQNQVQWAKAQEHSDLNLASGKLGKLTAITDVSTGIPAVTLGIFKKNAQGKERVGVKFLLDLIGAVRNGFGDAINTGFNTADAKLHAGSGVSDIASTPAAPAVNAPPLPALSPFQRCAIDNRQVWRQLVGPPATRQSINYNYTPQAPRP